MIASAAQPQCVFEAAAELGEGPLWHSAHDCLYWVDIKRQLLWCYRHGDAVQRNWRMPKPVSAVIGTTGTALLVFLSDGIYRFEPESQALNRVLAVDEDAGNRLNDATIGADGNLWFGTMDDAEERQSGGFFYCDAEFNATPILDDICITNGPALNAAADTIYFTDTLRRRVYRKSIAANAKPATLDGATLFVELNTDEGHPDGMCCDCDDNLWLCHWGSGMLSCYSQQGALLQRYFLPVSNVTKCAFGGSDLRSLYITTAHKGLEASALTQQPLAGGLFVLENAAQGFETPLFKLRD